MALQWSRNVQSRPELVSGYFSLHDIKIDADARVAFTYDFVVGYQLHLHL